MARKILLADDSVTAQNMGRKILADAGYEVIAVNNGSAALKKIAELKPDLVILDVYMPGYSGLEVCQRLKESPETARIPVLLTVGKLEPFKPEEAQRVRAEGYIVKPFEASELLSALSKLEDKVVPRAEPSKPGRFARAIAAVDDADSNSRNQPSSSETGWKNRIAFPSTKKESEETESQPVGTDGGPRKQKRRRDSEEPETHVDVAAFAPIGVPKEVKAEEVAAIAAAAAKIQLAEAAGNQSSATDPSPANSEFAVEPALERFEDKLTGEIQPSSAAPINPLPESPSTLEQAGNLAEVSNDGAAAELNHRSNGDEKLQDTPVTMAAASESALAASAGSSRWTAVPVALDSTEASLSLDQEMQKSYASFNSADYATSAGAVESEPVSPENSSATVESMKEAPAETSSAAEPEAIPQPEAALPAASLETKSPDFAAQDVQPVSDASFVNPQEETAASVPAPEPQTEVQTEVSASDTEFCAAEALATSAPCAPVAETSSPTPDTETVKTTAAAWANWRQIRDTSKDNETPESQSQELAVPELAPADTAALAVAAGAEQALLEATSAAPTENPADVASIVESVLAGLRPKLMEEITRKMAEKK